MLPNRRASAQEWIDAGFATPAEKAKRVDLTKMSFAEAEASGLVYLNGRAAEIMDREAWKKHSG
jgi:hypothetical protein